MNQTKKIHNYQDGSSPHKVNVFNINTAYCFFYISCDNCKLKAQCEPFRHKREICELANEARDVLTDYTVGHVTSFASDDFYIQIRKKNRDRKRELKKALFQLWYKYAANTK